MKKRTNNGKYLWKIASRTMTKENVEIGCHCRLKWIKQENYEKSSQSENVNTMN